MQTDPIGYQGGMNLYAYVGGDPVNGVDPLGLARFCDSACVSGLNGIKTISEDSQRLITVTTQCSDGWVCISGDQWEAPHSPTRFFVGDDGGGAGGARTDHLLDDLKTAELVLTLAQ